MGLVAAVRPFRGRVLQFLGLLAFASLSGCGQGPQADAGQGDVLARVNGQEITAQELVDILAKAGERASPEARRRALDRLVDQRLLEQAAVAGGLDRQAPTERALEFARRELLAQAAIDKAVGGLEVSARDAQAFYASRPELFANRKVYAFRRFVVERGLLERGLKARLDAARTAQAVTAILNDTGVQYSQFTEIRTAESLPRALLLQAAGMSTGDILLFRDGTRTVLMQLADSTADPIGMEAALPGIQRYLGQVRRQQKAERLVKDLRRDASIEMVQQTARVPATSLAEGAALLNEPPLKRPIQSQQTTVVR